MDNKDLEFQKRILATFRMEAGEHIKAFSDNLLLLEKNDGTNSSAGIVEILFREIHSLKGAARSVNQKEIESICQPLESILSSLKRDEITLSTQLFDLLHEIAGLLHEQLKTELFQENDRKKQHSAILHMREFLKGTLLPLTDHMAAKESVPKKEIIYTAHPGESKNKSDKVSSAPLGSIDVVRIPTSKLDPLFQNSEGFTQMQLSLKQKLNELNEILVEIEEWKSEHYKDRLVHSKATERTQDECYENTERRIINLEEKLARITSSLELEHFGFVRLINDNNLAVKELLMLPVSALVESFPMMVREISRQQNKEIEFTISGADLEIDKRIHEELKDPIIHLLRNCIDHGIESTAERVQNNKPAKGKISISFMARENNLIELIIADDGQGINTNSVLKAAIKSGLVMPETQNLLREDEIYALLFHFGLSTSPMITELSGHGIGLSIVRDKVEKLNGKITIESKIGVGTSFHIILPMTVSAFRGIEVLVGDYSFILPTLYVEKIIRLLPEEIKSIDNQETIVLENEIISLWNLSFLLGLPRQPAFSSAKKSGIQFINEYQKIILLKVGSKRIAFRVDDVLDEQQVVVKGLGKLLKRVKNISGVTVIGSGKIVPLLHAGDLVNSLALLSARNEASTIPEISSESARKILIAEDSVTSRTLLKNILETAGFLVTTAVDGADALSKVKNELFDLIISDIDMPRMNGFELTTKIKSDHQLKEIPVILVSSLESREDLEKGVDSGADGYIIKSKFEQGNLLEIIHKLI